MKRWELSHPRVWWSPACLVATQTSINITLVSSARPGLNWTTKRNPWSIDRQSKAKMFRAIWLGPNRLLHRRSMFFLFFFFLCVSLRLVVLGSTTHGCPWCLRKWVSDGIGILVSYFLTNPFWPLATCSNWLSNRLLLWILGNGTWMTSELLCAG